MSGAQSAYIGLLVGTHTGKVYGVIDPDHDGELDNPRLLLMKNDRKEPVTMFKAERGAYEQCLSMNDVDALVTQFYVRENYKPDDPPPGGEEYIDPTVTV